MTRTTGAELIAQERESQQTSNGFDADHDRWRGPELLAASICYGYAAMNKGAFPPGRPPEGWPWGSADWKPAENTVRNLVKSGALAAAAIDAFQAGA
jgi:hypothetical protein